MNKLKELPKILQCECNCSNCLDGELCWYSGYHCKHAEEMGFEYGKFESLGFCVMTGFMPNSSWRKFYNLRRDKASYSFKNRKLRI